MNKDIIFLNPVCTHNIWGGTRLNREFGYPIEGDDIGPSGGRSILSCLVIRDWIVSRY